MRTLKEISSSNPSTYRVDDPATRSSYAKSNDDRIHILLLPEGKTKTVTRRSAAKFGLCEKA